MSKVRIACTASGGGRTILNLLDRIEAGTLDASIELVLADRSCAAIERCANRGLQVELIPWTRTTDAEEWAERAWTRIEESGATLVCHAGFLRLLVVPRAWNQRVMNIHPALLPKYGGKGMWGEHVHRAVLESGDSESGCTVHFATNQYDAGAVIVQRRVPVQDDDTVETLAARVFEAECEAYPEAIRLFGADRLTIEDGKVKIRDE